MKTLTLSVADDLYQQAHQKATELDTSLNRVVQGFLEQWAAQDDHAALVARLELLFAEADARDSDKTGSIGPFSREELYAERLNRFR